MSKLKVGDKVSIRDRSYAFGISKGEYATDCPFPQSEREGLTVITTDLKVMKNADRERKGEYTTVCDILVTNGDGGFWFTQSRLVDLSAHTIIIDGQEIEISNKSFESLKKQLS